MFNPIKKLRYNIKKIKRKNNMQHNIPTRVNFSEAYDSMLGNVYYRPHYESSPRGQKIKERINETYTIINPKENLFLNTERELPSKYLAGELYWYFTGDNKVKTISKYSGFWSNIANKDGTLNSAYGDLIFKRKNKHGYNQWQWAYDSLSKDKDSRQAIMYFGRPDFQEKGVKDFVCTCFGMFLIRENKLHFTVTMRSNDLIKGTTFDIPFFTLLHQNMYVLLKDVYQDLELGEYTHNAISLHIYERDFELVEKMLDAGFTTESLPEMKVPLVDKKGYFKNLNMADPLHKWISDNKNV